MVPTHQNSRLETAGGHLCHYINTTSHIQVIRLGAVDGESFEKVVFPGQRLFFEAEGADLLEVFTGCPANESPASISSQQLTLQVERIPCHQLTC
jgi:hypothetical protein